MSASCVRGALRLFQRESCQKYHPNIAHSIRLNATAKTHGQGDEYRKLSPGWIVSTG
jgi:hypothetical protein